MSDFNNEVFATFKGFGYLLKIFDAEGRGPLASPEKAVYMQATNKQNSDFNMMIRLPTESSTAYPELVIYKSPEMDAKLFATLKRIAESYGNTITVREFGRSIKAKDIGYMAKATREENKETLGEAMEIDETSVSPFMNPEKFEKQRRIEQRQKQARHEIEWCKGKIEELKPRLEKKPSTIKQIRDLERQIKEREQILSSFNTIDESWQSDEDGNCCECGGSGSSYGETCLNCGGFGTHEKEHEYNKDLESLYDNDWSRKSKRRNESVTILSALVEGYEKTGSTRSSYHTNPKAKNARIIIRHSKVIDETQHGARSRNVKNLYVESTDGEKRLVETKSLMAARALANHVNNGGKLYDESANNILRLSSDLKEIKSLKRKYPVTEDESSQKVHDALGRIDTGLSQMMKLLNTSKIHEYTPHLQTNQPNVAFAQAYYGEKLGEGYDTEALARGSAIYSQVAKHLKS